MISMCLRTKWGDITSEGEWELMSADPVPGREIPEVFKGRQVLPNMTVWQFEPNGFVNMQSRVQGISVWVFWDSKPTVKKLRIRQSWTSGPAATTAPHLLEAPDRSAAEERAHAID
jgi:hypothetical protein